MLFAVMDAETSKALISMADSVNSLACGTCTLDFGDITESITNLGMGAITEDWPSSIFKARSGWLGGAVGFLLVSVPFSSP